MDINNLTIGQAKELASMFGGESNTPTTTCRHIGKKCIIRTYASGVHYGTLVSQSGRHVALENSRRIWRFDVKSHGISLSEVANHGTTDSRSKVCEVLPSIDLLDALEIIPCTDEAVEVIEVMPVAMP